MKQVTLDEINERIRQIGFPKFDLIIAIAKGGINPAVLLSKHLGLKVDVLEINYRDEQHNPKYEEPKLIKDLETAYENKKILLVDDVSRTGKTLNKAKEILEKKNNKVKTFVVNGKADFSLYDEDCFLFPW